MQQPFSCQPFSFTWMEIYNTNVLEHMALLADFYMHIKVLAISITLCIAGTMKCSEREGWRKPVFKSWSEVEGWVQGGGWLWVRRQLAYGREQIPNPATAVRKFSWGPRGNETGIHIQERTETSRAHWTEGKLVYKPFRIALFFSRSVFSSLLS